MVRLGLGLGGQLLSLRKAYISNLILLQTLHPIEKFVKVVGGGGVQPNYSDQPQA